MKNDNDSSVPETTILSRRAALRRVVATGLGLGGLNALAAEPAVSALPAEPDFVPENDYPYFGYEAPGL